MFLTFIIVKIIFLFLQIFLKTCPRRIAPVETSPGRREIALSVCDQGHEHVARELPLPTSKETLLCVLKAVPIDAITETADFTTKGAQGLATEGVHLFLLLALLHLAVKRPLLELDKRRAAVFVPMVVALATIVKLKG